jgi:hypothetical protein
MLEGLAFFDISFQSLNLFSAILGMFFASTMWRVQSMYFVAFYFIGVAAFYAFLH